MPILQWIKEFRFDLSVADRKISPGECMVLTTTFKHSAPPGEGNAAIDRILDIAKNRGIAKHASAYPNGAIFQEFLNYLQKRAE